MQPKDCNVTPEEGSIKRREIAVGLRSVKPEKAINPNILVPEEPKRGVLWILQKGLGDPMALLLMAAGATYALLGERLEAAITFGAVVPVIAVGLVLEIRAENALERLREATKPVARVLREGKFAEIPATQIVEGDIVSLEEGDIVPADGRVLETRQLSVDESPLTGESLPVDKAPWSSSSTDPSASRVKAGTIVLSGQALFVVEAVGGETEYGRLARTVARSKPSPTPLQKTIRRLIVRLGAVAAVFCVTVAAVELFYGHGIGAAVTAGVSLGIAAVPEEFPIVFALYLSLGAWRLTRQRALVKRLTSVESLGSTTVICADKTGTLTEGRLVVSALWSPRGDTAQLLRAALFACEPEPYDPLERAIFEHASRVSMDTHLTKEAVLLVDHAFDPHSKYMSHVWRIGERCITFAKGSPEAIYGLTEVTEEIRREAERFTSSMASQGMRLIAVAAGPAPEKPGNRADDESNLELMGLVAFFDPPRDGVSEALDACRRAGIKVMILTGDHPLTAAAVAEELGLLDSESAGSYAAKGRTVALGPDLDSSSEEAFDRMVREATVIARIRPEQKYDIVRHLKASGEVVAMTGDGINDAPALREADIGVAMGMRGTEVARASADLVLLDDNFATIVAAVENGRRIFDNLSKAFAYLIAFHIPLLLGALTIPLMRLPLLLLPLHLVLLEIVLHPTVGLAFENEPAEPDIMDRPPRPPRQNLVSATRLLRTALAGLALFVAVVFVYVSALARGASVEKARTLAFSALLLGNIAILLAELRPHQYLWRFAYRKNPSLFPLISGMVLVLLVAVYTPAVSRIFQMAAVPPLELFIYASSGAAAVGMTELLKGGAGRLFRPR